MRRRRRRRRRRGKGQERRGEKRIATGKVVPGLSINVNGRVLNHH
jgi:U3 small nucleolar ribonucleoprotein component